MRTALQRFINIQTRVDPKFQIPQWVEDAFDHKDMTILSPDQQRALALAYLLEMPESKKHNRVGTDGLLKEILRLLVLKGNFEGIFPV